MTGQSWWPGPLPWVLGTSNFVKPTNTGTWSYSIWVKPTSTIVQRTLNQAIWGGGNTPQSHLIWPSNPSPDGVPAAGLCVGTNGIQVVEHANSYYYARTLHDATANPMVDWTHIVVVLSGGTYTVYRDGVSVSTGAAGFANVWRGDVLGSHWYGSYSGLADEWTSWNEELSAADVTALYNSGAGYDLIEAAYSGGGGGGGSVDGIVAMSLGDGTDTIIQIGKMDIS